MLARLLVVALAALLPFEATLAQLDPPDQTWIGGFYDDADYDDVVLLVAATASPPPTAFPQCPDPHWDLVWRIAAADEPPPPFVAPPRQLSRGPPHS